VQQIADGMVLWFLILAEQAGKQAPAGQAKNNQMQGQKKAPGQHAAAGQTPKQSPAAQQAGGSPGKVQLNKAPPAATAAKTASPPQPTDAQPPTAATGAAKPQAGGAHVASSAENLLRQKLLQAQQQKKNAAAATEAKQDAAPDAAEATAGKRLRSTVEVSSTSSVGRQLGCDEDLCRSRRRKAETRATQALLEILRASKTRAREREGSFH